MIETEEQIETQIEVKTLESEERQTIVHCSCDGDGTCLLYTSRCV